MIRAHAVGTLTLLLVATPSFASDDFRLDLSWVARSLSANGTQTDIVVSAGGTVAATPGDSYVVELRYRINDNNADTVGSRGLASSQIRISANPFANGTLSRQPLTAVQEDPSTIDFYPGYPPLNPDIFGQGSGVTGLHSIYRGGLVGDDDPGNGGLAQMNTPGLSIDQFFILPLTLSSPGFNSWRPGTSPTVANTNTNQFVSGIYSFLFTYRGGEVVFSASATPDQLSGNRFAYFDRIGSMNNPIPQTSKQAKDGVIRFIPAPSTFLLLVIVSAATRRRMR